MVDVIGPGQLKSQLVRAARRRGFAVERDRQSQLVEYIAYQVRLDEQAGQLPRPRRTLDQALGLLAGAWLNRR